MRKISSLRYRKVSFGLLCVLFIFLGFLVFEGYAFYQISIENNRLIGLKNDYLELCEKIDTYKTLKGQYEIVLDESNVVDINKAILEKKVIDLNKEIIEIEAKIRDVNKKIKSYS